MSKCRTCSDLLHPSACAAHDFEMNYQHLYAYLNSRPVDEQIECMHNVVRITRNRLPTASLDRDQETEETIVLRASDVMHELKRLRAAQHVWKQQAVWNRFGSGASDQATTDLLMEPQVTAFLARINRTIDNEVNNCAEVTVPTTSTLFVETPVWGSSTVSVTSSPAGTFSPDHEVGTKRKRANAEATVKRFMWTTDMDSSLRKAVSGRDDPVDWSVVARQVGCGLNDKQCRLRWKYKLKPLELGMKQGEDWTADELAKLRELVAQHTTLPPQWNKAQQKMGESRIDWTAIGAALGRLPMTCNGKWYTLRQRNMKGGPFTPAEDALIRQRVAEWGDKGMGLWVSLEKEMNRSDGAIAKRWNTLSLRTDA